MRTSHAWRDGQRTTHLICSGYFCTQCSHHVSAHTLSGFFQGIFRSLPVQVVCSSHENFRLKLWHAFSSNLNHQCQRTEAGGLVLCQGAAAKQRKRNPRGGRMLQPGCLKCTRTGWCPAGQSIARAILQLLSLWCSHHLQGQAKGCCSCVQRQRELESTLG